MADALRHWRKAGGALGFIADTLTIAMQNWGLLLSAALGLGAGTWAFAFKVINDPHVQTIGGVFLWSLWSYIGLSVLYRLHNGIKTVPTLDYAFGIILEGFTLGSDDADDGNVQVGINFRNIVNGAISLRVSEIGVILDGRTNQDTPLPAITIPRLGTKGVLSAPFKKTDLGDGVVEGFFDITILYGPHDGEPVRKSGPKASFTSGSYSRSPR